MNYSDFLKNHVGFNINTTNKAKFKIFIIEILKYIYLTIYILLIKKIIKINKLLIKLE